MDTVVCDKCHEKAEFIVTVHNNEKNIHYDLYVCEECGHENKVPIPSTTKKRL